VTLTQVITKATFPPVPTSVIVLTLAWYVWSVRRLAARGRKWPIARTASFCVAELFLAIGLVSGVDAFDENFAVHSVQHIFIGMLAPIFLALSAPVTLALQASSRRVQTGLLKVLHSPPARLLTNPMVTWPVYGVSLFVLYFTNIYADTLTNPTLHDLVHLHLIFTGCLFWSVAVGIDPLPGRLGPWLRMFYLLVAIPFHTILGMALESQTSPIAPDMSLSQLHTGGGLMWVAGEATALIGVLAIFVQWLRADEREARRYDRLTTASAQLQLALWRETREAAARAAQPR
jgi:putative copper resistance protein D